MRKEIFYAIFAGSILGLVIAFGVWRTNSTLKPSPTPVASADGQKTTGNPSNNTKTLGFDLTIAKPGDGDLFTQNPVTISGITKAGSLVTISTEDQDFMLQAENNGSFSQDVTLLGGTNQIVVTSFDGNGDSVVKELTVVYSKEFANK